MQRYVISEGSRTAWGGRTVKVELAGDPPQLSAHNERWTDADDDRLLELQKAKLPFKQIARRLGRTPHACRNRYELLMRRGRVA